MLARQLLSQILDNDALTRGLGDPEARVLVEWLVDCAEQIAVASDCDHGAQAEVTRLLRRARSVSRFVNLWCYQAERGAAGQFATAERLNWPLPDADVDPCELMQAILAWEDRQRQEFGNMFTESNRASMPFAA